MNLSEKIYSCRKKAGLSQEALAEKLGVSRQAVSKWETAEAIPELSKIPMMAKMFGVTADWLLSDKEDFTTPSPEEEQHGQYSSPKDAATPSWINELPNTASTLFRKYGWLLGVYIAILGGLIAILGTVILLFATHATDTMEDMYTQFYESIEDEFYYDWNDFELTTETKQVN